MADRADDNGYLYPSLDWIALQMSESRDTAKRAVAALKRMGVLSVVDRTEGGRGRTPTYLLNVAELELLAVKGGTGAPVTDESIDSERGASLPEKGGTGAPKGVRTCPPIHKVSIRDPIASAHACLIAATSGAPPNPNAGVDQKKNSGPREITAKEAIEINRPKSTQEMDEHTKQVLADPKVAAKVAALRQVHGLRRHRA